MLARAESVAVVGLDGHPVDVEVSITSGLPMFTIVGLPDVSVQEARERVRAAIQNSKEKWPDRRITVNLSPAQLRKAGSGFDLAIALGIVAANGDGVSDESLRGIAIVGELSLDGSVRRVRGVLAAALAARAHGRRGLVVPRANASEAALVEGLRVLPVDHLRDAVGHLRGRVALDAYACGAPNDIADADDVDLAEVRGQQTAKRALEIAAAGAHNLFMRGTPGGGKTMLARRLPGMLPPLTNDEALEVTRIYSVAGLLPDDAGLIRRRPFRAPHHTVSTAGLIGGGSGVAQPGEISLANRGVLFLDEVTEFRRDSLESLRGPIEDGTVTVVRSRFAVTYPSRFQLIAAANPCPCGYADDEKRGCTCLPGRRAAYQQRLSGPIIDRLDLQVDVPRLTRGEIFGSPDGEASAVVRERVTAARERQHARHARYGFASNAEIPVKLLDRVCPRTPAAQRAIEREVENRRLTGRGAHRLLRVARTIADLEGRDAIEISDVNEAVRYRVEQRA